MSLNKDNKDIGYLLGRLFAVLEKIQEDASPGGINATIRDKFYSSASATPVSVFGGLMRLKNQRAAKIQRFQDAGLPGSIRAKESQCLENLNAFPLDDVVGEFFGLGGMDVAGPKINANTVPNGVEVLQFDFDQHLDLVFAVFLQK